MSTIQNRAVVERRHEAPDSLDFFPTPPWATRALGEWLRWLYEEAGLPLAETCCWEPAAGEGHMAEPLREYFGTVYASDVHDYGAGYVVGSFVGEGPDVLAPPWRSAPDMVPWVISNPPFNLAEAFLMRAIGLQANVALLLRSVWTEGEGRYERMFKPGAFLRPNHILQFSERVPMTKGRWDPDAKTATSYAWFVWEAGDVGPRETVFDWIGPGRKRALTKPTDRARFAAWKREAALAAQFSGPSFDPEMSKR